MFRWISCLFLLAAPACACDAPVTLSDAQAREALTTLTDTASESFNKYLAFQTLACSDQLVLRQLGQRAALASGDPALQAGVLFEVMMSRESLILQAVDSDAMTEEDQAWARANPGIAFSFAYVDRANSCVSLASHSTPTCDGNRVIDVRGNGISIVYDNSSAELAMTANGDLEGYYYPGEESLRIPVTAELF